MCPSCVSHSSIYLYTLAVSPSLGGSRQHKERTKTMGVLLHFFLAVMRDTPKFGWHCWSNTAHPPPSSTTCITSWMPSPLLLRPQGCPYKAAPGNSRCQSELCRNHSPFIPIPSTLTCLPHIHPPIIQGSLYSIHPSTQA